MPARRQIRKLLGQRPGRVQQWQTLLKLGHNIQVLLARLYEELEDKEVRLNFEHACACHAPSYQQLPLISDHTATARRRHPPSRRRGHLTYPSPIYTQTAAAHTTILSSTPPTPPLQFIHQKHHCQQIGLAAVSEPGQDLVVVCASTSPGSWRLVVSGWHGLRACHPFFLLRGVLCLQWRGQYECLIPVTSF
jgi:hypothetical protein